jgi:2-isopropylmalate synthase
MHPQVGKTIYDLADSQSKELTPAEIREAFFEHFVNVSQPLQLIEYHLEQSSPAQVVCHARIIFNGVEKEISGEGNGPINSFVHALETAGLKDFTLTDYRSHAIRGGSDSDSAAYIQLRANENNRIIWGCGVDPSIEMAGLKSLVSSYNLLHG